MISRIDFFQLVRQKMSFNFRAAELLFVYWQILQILNQFGIQIMIQKWSHAVNVFEALLKIMSVYQQYLNVKYIPISENWYMYIYSKNIRSEMMKRSQFVCRLFVISLT